MTAKEFHEKYYSEIIDILDRFSQVEGDRISNVIKNGNHYNISGEKEHLDILIKSRMIRNISITTDDEE